LNLIRCVPLFFRGWTYPIGVILIDMTIVR